MKWYASQNDHFVLVGSRKLVVFFSSGEQETDHNFLFKWIFAGNGYVNCEKLEYRSRKALFLWDIFAVVLESTWKSELY